MTNKERRDARYKRRKEKRLMKRLEMEKLLCDFDKAISIEELEKSFYKTRAESPLL